MLFLQITRQLFLFFVKKLIVYDTEVCFFKYILSARTVCKDNVNAP